MNSNELKLQKDKVNFEVGSKEFGGLFKDNHDSHQQVPEGK